MVDFFFFFFQAEDGIRDYKVTGVQTCALPILRDRQLAIAYADRGVTVNAICPGAIQTGLRANSVRILGADAPEMRGIGGDEAAVRAITPAGGAGPRAGGAAGPRCLPRPGAGHRPGPPP